MKDIFGNELHIGDIIMKPHAFGMGNTGFIFGEIKEWYFDRMSVDFEKLGFRPAAVGSDDYHLDGHQVVKPDREQALNYIDKLKNEEQAD